MKHDKQLRNTRAFTLIEAAVSVFIVGVMIVAALSTVGATRLGEYKVAESCRGWLLAQALMAEILQQPYEEPDDPVVFGLESGESIGDRLTFDDVDDYDGWTETPPQYKDGTTVPDCDGWSRTVATSTPARRAWR